MTDMTLENALSAIESEADSIGGEYHYVASRLYEAVESIRDHLAKAAQPVEAVDVGGILNGLDRDIESASSTIQRPLEISQAKDEYWRAGLHAGITRARAEIALVAHQLRALSHPRPTGEQAGEVVGRMVVHEDPLVEANYGITSWKQEVIAKMPPGEYPLYAQPRPVGVPDEEIKASVIDFLHDVNHLPLIAAAELLVARLKSLAAAPDGELG